MHARTCVCVYAAWSPLAPFHRCETLCRGLGLAILVRPKAAGPSLFVSFASLTGTPNRNNLQVSGFILAYDFRGFQIITADMMVSPDYQLDLESSRRQISVSVETFPKRFD